MAARFRPTPARRAFTAWRRWTGIAKKQWNTSPRCGNNVPRRRRPPASKPRHVVGRQRLGEALATVQQRQAERTARGRTDAKPEEARASETDADARKMKRSHGG